MTNRDGSKIPRNAIRISQSDDSRFQRTPSEQTYSLRLNGAGPNVIHPLDWPEVRYPMTMPWNWSVPQVCSHCQSAQSTGCGYCKDYDEATE
jgi:hypothetical protein